MPDARGRVLNNTDLSADTTEERGVIHRDLIAHALRWSHIAQYLRIQGRYKTARILDIGCGSDIPLPRMLHSNRLLVKEYVGVDFNPTSKFKERAFGSMNVSLYGGTIFPRDIKIGNSSYRIKEGSTRHPLPNYIVSLEVLEHVSAKHCRRMVSAMHKIASKSGAELFISTPCWNVKDTAANHCNEMRHAALGTLFEDIGFEILHNYGTFGNIYDYQDALFEKYGEGIKRFFSDQRDYHDTNVIANMFCSPFPHLSRNSIWHLKPAKPDYARKFPSWDVVPTPWTSCDNWIDLAGNASTETQDMQQ